MTTFLIAAAAAAALSAADRTFVMDAAADSMAEVRLGRLADQKAAHDDVEDFGEKMEKDHTRANGELTGIAASKAVTLPADVEPEHKAVEDRLSRLSGAAFDREYTAEMVKAHEKAVALFEKQAKEGTDPDVKAFASRNLPLLRQHLEHARSLAARVGAPASAAHQH